MGMAMDDGHGIKYGCYNGCRNGSMDVMFIMVVTVEVGYSGCMDVVGYNGCMDVVVIMVVTVEVGYSGCSYNGCYSRGCC